MIVKDLSNSFNPVPKPQQKSAEKKKNTAEIKKKSSKLAKLEKNRFSILTNDLEHCYMCKAKKQDLHELIGGKNRQASMKYGLVIPVCRKCHNLIENNEALKQKWHKVGQEEFEKQYKSENFMQIFRKNYL